VIIRASDTVTVIVEQQADGRMLFSGTLAAGDATPLLERSGPVKVRFTSGQATVIETDGKQQRPGTEGMGWVVVR
jgi:hypothetical protein